MPFPNTSPWSPIFWLGFAPYIAGLLFIGYTWRRMRKNSQLRALGWRSLSLPLLLAASCVLRVLFFAEAMRIHGTHKKSSTTWANLVNRGSMDLEFLAFSLVADHWRRISSALFHHRQVDQSKRIVAANVVLWTSNVVFLVLKAGASIASMDAMPLTGEGLQRIHTANVHPPNRTFQLLKNGVPGISFNLYAVVELGGGLWLYAALRKRAPYLLHRRSFRLLLGCALGSTALNLLRGTLFLYVALHGRLHGTVNDVLYPWMFYHVPQIGQAVLVCASLLPRRSQSVADAQGEGGQVVRSVALEQPGSGTRLMPPIRWDGEDPNAGPLANGEKAPRLQSDTSMSSVQTDEEEDSFFRSDDVPSLLAEESVG